MKLVLHAGANADFLVSLDSVEHNNDHIFWSQVFGAVVPGAGWHLIYFVNRHHWSYMKDYLGFPYWAGLLWTSGVELQSTEAAPDAR